MDTIGYRNKSDYVFQEVYDQIVTGKLAPGMRFSAHELAEQLNVSRTPVNAAMKRLSEYGLIKILPNVGYEVVVLNWKDIEEILQIEFLLEKQALSWTSVPVDAELLSELLSLSAKIRTAFSRKKRRDYSLYTNHFHRKFIDISGSAVLGEIFEKTRHYGGWNDAILIELNDDLIPVLDDHDEILALLAAGNIESARPILEKHHQTCSDLIKRAISRRENGKKNRH